MLTTCLEKLKTGRLSLTLGKHQGMSYLNMFFYFQIIGKWNDTDCFKTIALTLKSYDCACSAAWNFIDENIIYDGKRSYSTKEDLL